jgi:hypothetical protein
MNAHDQERMRKLLQQALPPVDRERGPGRDLWPGLLRRLDARAVTPHWFDWALLAGLVGLATIFPASIPVLLYYL